MEVLKIGERFTIENNGRPWFAYGLFEVIQHLPDTYTYVLKRVED